MLSPGKPNQRDAVRLPNLACRILCSSVGYLSLSHKLLQTKQQKVAFFNLLLPLKAWSPITA